MYTLVECFIIAGFTVFVGAGLFLAVAMVVLLKAGVRVVVEKSLPLATHASTDLRKKLDTSPLAQAAGQGD
jgi:hypothetical protein